jgi:hypothetical protein
MCDPGYDSKLYIFAMSQMIQRAPNEFNEHLIDRMVTLLSKQKIWEEKQAKKKAAGDDSSSEEHIDNDSDGEYDSEVSDARLQFESFKSLIMVKDEF